MPYREANDQDEGDLETGTRVCKGCGERKSMRSFHWANGRTSRRRKCNVCVSVRRAELWAESPEKKGRNAFTAWRSHIKLKYGLTPETFDGMFEAQDGRCGVCQAMFGLDQRVPHIDHDHKTGQVRGLLCFTCNTAIGKLKDDPALLRRAALYLEGAL